MGLIALTDLWPQIYLLFWRGLQIVLSVKTVSVSVFVMGGLRGFTHHVLLVWAKSMHTISMVLKEGYVSKAAKKCLSISFLESVLLWWDDCLKLFFFFSRVACDPDAPSLDCKFSSGGQVIEFYGFKDSKVSAPNMSSCFVVLISCAQWALEKKKKKKT